MDVDTDACDGKSDGAGVGVGFDKNATCLARTDEEIVGPAEIDGEGGVGVDGFSGCEPSYKGKERKAGRGDLRAEKDGDIESLAGG
jgi:hypothetical protein